MASETATPQRTGTETAFAWRPGLLAGLVGGVVMGVMLTMQMTPVIENAIPAMYGLTGLAAGWVAHLFHAAVLGVAFAYLVDAAGWRSRAAEWGASVAVGAGYGVVLWVVLAAVVMPVWLSSVGFPGAPALPNFNPMSLVGHVVYGVVLGGVYTTLVR
jgi:hypothetical protein